MQKLIALIFGMALCLPCFSGAFSAYATDTAVQELLPREDTFQAPLTSILSPAAFLSHALGTALPPEEIAWLEQEASSRFPDLSLTYDCYIPHTMVALTFTEDEKILISAMPYTGEAMGTQWIPHAVTLGGQDHPLTQVDDNTYTATLDAPSEPLVSVTVQYNGNISSPKETVNELLNAAHDRASEISEAYAAYELAQQSHEAATEAYGAYRTALQIYAAEMSLYQAYLKEKTAYEQKEAAYQAYLSQLATYAQQLEAYETYLAEKAAYDKALAEYTDHIAHPEKYEQTYLAYCAWLEDMATVKAQLDIIDSCFVSDSVGHVLNNTLNGPTVATVVARQDELVSVGCDARDISNADLATKMLISLLKDYPQESDDAARYAYYIRHYATLRDNVTLLYTSLSRLYSNDAVPDILEMQGRKERYWQFVAQLYALSCALEDKITFDRNWSISQGKLTELLEDCFILEDRNTAVPLPAYPTPMEEVIPPGQLMPPTPPKVVERPSAPLKVNQPTPPDEVKKPVPPTVVPSPGKAPVAPQYSTRELSLYHAFRAGKLRARTPLSADVAYPLTLSVGKCAAEGYHIAAFYDYDRMTLLQCVLADEDGRISFPDTLPSRPSASGYTYTFSCWMDGADNVYPDTQHTAIISHSTEFYAVYASEKEHFTITWEVDGVKTQMSCAFGEIPDYGELPCKAADETYLYEFAGWSPALSPADEDTVYTAIFTPHKRSYTLQWVIGDDLQEESYEAGETPLPPVSPEDFTDGRYYHRFKGWSPEISQVTGPAVYTAHYEVTDLLAGVAQGSVTEVAGSITATYPAEVKQPLPIGSIVAFAAARESSLTLALGSYLLSFDEETVRSLQRADISSMSMTTDALSHFSVTLTDCFGHPLRLQKAVRLSVNLPEGQTGRLLSLDGTVISTIKASEMMSDLTVGEFYQLYMGYSLSSQVTVKGDPQAMGGICSLPEHPVAPGETATLTITPAPGYRLRSLVARDKWGEVIPTTSQDGLTYTLTMPRGDVFLSAEMLPLTYTVTFTSDGHILSSAVYRYGDEPTLPETPTKASDDTFSYTFTGWSPAVTAVMDDTTYTAKFMAVPLVSNDSVTDSGIGILELIFIGLGAFCITCAGILAPYILVSRQKAALKATKEDDAP